MFYLFNICINFLSLLWFVCLLFMLIIHAHIFPFFSGTSKMKCNKSEKKKKKKKVLCINAMMLFTCGNMKHCFVFRFHIPQCCMMGSLCPAGLGVALNNKMPDGLCQAGFFLWVWRGDCPVQHHHPVTTN